jgi:hypothetical protein
MQADEEIASWQTAQLEVVGAQFCRDCSTCCGVAGSLAKWRSLIRTQPILTLRAASTDVVPKTNSVDPPPISTTRNGPSEGSRS